MALLKSAESQASRPAVTLSQAGQAVAVRGKYAVAANLALNDVIQLVTLPAGAVIEDLVLDIDPLDTNGTPTTVLQVGVLNSAGTGISGPVLLATTGAQSKAAGVLRAVLEDALRVEPSPVQRQIGALVQTAAATNPTITGSLGTNKGKWQASTAYVLTDYITLTNGQVMKVTTAGTSGTTQPEFDSSNQATTTDGTVTWTACRPLVGLTVKYRNVDQRG